MKILVDTCIWSLALRRGEGVEGLEVSELSELIRELRVQMIGPVRQELLSGIKIRSHFLKLCIRPNDLRQLQEAVFRAR